MLLYLTLNVLSLSKSRSYGRFISRKEAELGHTSLLNTNRKSNMGTSFLIGEITFIALNSNVIPKAWKYCPKS